MDRSNHLKYARLIAILTDKRFKLFGFRFGIDPLIGLIPGFGDALSFLLSLYLLWVGLQLKIPQSAILKMFTNLVIDFVLGSLPIIGDALDFIYRANIKNLEILKQYDKGDVIEAEIVM